MTGSRGVDIRQEPLIIKPWIFPGLAGQLREKGVLVTGASSYIGCHLVKALQAHGIGPLHLIVRAHTADAARLKFSQAFAAWTDETPDLSSLYIHAGEMSRQMMGLSRPEWRQVWEETGEVVHLAMTSIYNMPYSHFRRTWIPDLEQVIAFCGDQEKPKALHYLVPSLVNLFQSDADFTCLELNAWQSGYAAFKWVASEAVMHAMSLGLPGCLYEVPAIVGSAGSGSCPRFYPVWQLTALFVSTGFYLPFEFSILPVDLLAEVIAWTIMGSGHGGSAVRSRPALAEPFDDRLFSHIAARLLGLEKADRKRAREACTNTMWFDYLVPENYVDLLHRASMKAVEFPAGFADRQLPATPLVVMSNLNRIFSPTREADRSTRYSTSRNH